MGGGRRFFLPANAIDPQTGRSNYGYGRLDGYNLVQVCGFIGLVKLCAAQYGPLPTLWHVLCNNAMLLPVHRIWLWALPRSLVSTWWKK